MKIKWQQIVRSSLYGIGGLVLVWGLVQMEEDVRGKKAWATWMASRASKGDRFEWVTPPPLKDSENFAAEPLVHQASCVPMDQAKPILGAFRMPSLNPPPGTWREGQREDLCRWAQAFNGRDLEAIFTPLDGPLEALARASHRPSCRIHSVLEPGTGMVDVPWLGIPMVAKVLRLRALWHLAAGRPSLACEDVLTILRVAQHVGFDDSLISSLLQMALAETALQPVWEGVQDHRWQTQDLARIQAELGKLDLLQGLARAWHQERMHNWRLALPLLRGSAWDRAKAMPAMVPFTDAAEAPKRPTFLRTFMIWALWPRGFFPQNMVASDRCWAEEVEPCLDPASHRFHADQAKSGIARMATLAQRNRHNPYRIMADLSLPALMGQNERAAFRQVGLDEAKVACALERYRIVHTSYPENLAGLVPAFLGTVPTDVPAGGQLRYQRHGAGYVLYSLGSNLTDEGGRVVLGKAPGSRPILGEGDWVWQVGPGR